MWQRKGVLLTLATGPGTVFAVKCADFSGWADRAGVRGRRRDAAGLSQQRRAADAGLHRLLGGPHDLTDSVRRLPGGRCDYLLGTTKGPRNQLESALIAPRRSKCNPFIRQQFAFNSPQKGGVARV